MAASCGTMGTGRSFEALTLDDVQRAHFKVQLGQSET
jgi:hypothetical protein